MQFYELLTAILSIWLIYWPILSISSAENSPKALARHYETLQELYKKPKPKQDVVSKIPELEFQAGRSFDSDVLNEQERPTKILDTYPCFQDLHHVSDLLVLIYYEKQALLQILMLTFIIVVKWAAAHPEYGQKKIQGWSKQDMVRLLQ